MHQKCLSIVNDSQNLGFYHFNRVWAYVLVLPSISYSLQAYLTWDSMIAAILTILNNQMQFLKYTEPHHFYFITRLLLLFIVWQRFCEPCQTKNCILSVNIVLSDISCLHGCSQWAIHLYMVWKYALVVPLTLFFYGTPWNFCWGDPGNFLWCLLSSMLLMVLHVSQAPCPCCLLLFHLCPDSIVQIHPD